MQEYSGSNKLSDRSERLDPCSICGRTFRPDVLARHKNICSKASKKKRKVFDSGKMRAQGSDIPINKALKPGQPPPPPDPKLAKAMARKDNWRMKHEEFISTIRAARQYNKSVETGGPLPPPPPPSYNPDFIQCDYCGRRFNEKAAERHIPFCKEKNSRISGDIANRKPQSQRTQYKPPAPRAKASPSTANNVGYGASGDSRGIPPPRAAGPRGTMNSTPQRNVPPGGATYQAGRYQSRGANVNSNNSELIDSDDQEYGYAPPGSITATNNNGVLLRTGKSQRDYLAAQEDIRSANGGYSGIPGPTRIKRPNGYKSAPRPQGPDTVEAILANNRTQIGGQSPLNSAGILNRFCHECGTKYPVQTAKFCCECGYRRAIS